MPILNKHPRWEAFCQGIGLRKLSAYESYKQAGYRANDDAARTNAARLLANADIKARIAELSGEVCSAAVADAVMSRDERLERLTARCRALDEVVAARAKDPEMLGVPGGSTGLLVKIWKTGREVRAEFQVDHALLRELRQTEFQISQELGEHKTAVEIRSSDIPALEIPENADLETIRAVKERMKAMLAELQKPTKTVQ